MTTEIQGGPETDHIHDTLILRVRYIAARKPLVDETAQKNASLAAIKPLVLRFFGLVEGGVDGGTKTYHFALDGIVLTDLGATLGFLADGKHELKLDFIERFEQG
ncbi:MAG: hypothetical protein ACYCY2_07990 [Acidithiobacillus ferriphilus]